MYCVFRAVNVVMRGMFGGRLFLVFFSNGITPHLLEPVELAVLAEHDMDNDIHVIDEHPLAGLVAFRMIRVFIEQAFYLGLHVLRDGPDLWLIVCLTNDKEIRDCFIDLTKVQGDNVLTLFFLYSGNDCFDDL